METRVPDAAVDATIREHKARTPDNGPYDAVAVGRQQPAKSQAGAVLIFFRTVGTERGVERLRWAGAGSTKPTPRILALFALGGL